jgi:hypothetical protein
LSEGEVGDILPYVWIYFVSIECRGSISAFGSIDHFIVPYDNMTILGQATWTSVFTCHKEKETYNQIPEK